MGTNDIKCTDQVVLVHKISYDSKEYRIYIWERSLLLYRIYVMEIIDSNNQVLANYEIFNHLSEVRRSIKRQQDSSQRGLSTVVYEALKYFDNSTTSKCDYSDEENLRQFSLALKPFALTKSETLQILNLRPTNAIEIQLIVEECEERLTEQQVDDLINLIEKCIPLKNSDTVGDNTNDMENGDQ